MISVYPGRLLGSSPILYIYTCTVSTIHIPQDISVVYTVGNNYGVNSTFKRSSGIIRVEPITKQQHQQRFGGSWTYEKPCKIPKDPNPSFNYFSRIFLMYLFRDCYKDFWWDIGGYFTNEHGAPPVISWIATTMKHIETYRHVESYIIYIYHSP